MFEVLQRAELVLDPQDRLRLDLAQRLERYASPLLAIERLEHHPHPALADAPHEAKPPSSQVWDLPRLAFHHQRILSESEPMSAAIRTAAAAAHRLARGNELFDHARHAI